MLIHCGPFKEKVDIAGCAEKHLLARAEGGPCLKCPTGTAQAAKINPPEVVPAQILEIPIVIEKEKPVVTPFTPLPEAPKTALKAADGKAIKICLECKIEKKIIGRGICSSCYGKLKTKGELEKYPAKATTCTFPVFQKPAPIRAEEKMQPAPDENFKKASSRAIRFLLPLLEQNPDLLSYLKIRMNSEFRDLENQILWIIKEAAIGARVLVNVSDADARRMTAITDALAEKFTERALAEGAITAGIGGD